MHHELHTQIEIDASPALVWQVLTDLDSYGQWNPFIVESNGEIAIGAKLTNRMQPPGGKAMTFRPVVTTVEPCRVFEWLGHLGVRGVFDGRHRFELEETRSGGTRVTQTERFDGVLVRLLRTSLDTQTKSGFEQMNAALKVRAENAAKPVS